MKEQNSGSKGQSNEGDEQKSNSRVKYSCAAIQSCERLRTRIEPWMFMPIKLVGNRVGGCPHRLIFHSVFDLGNY